MSNIVYIGKPSKYHGKRIFQILVNLKNFGVGRILERISSTEKHGKKTFCIVKEAYPQMDKELAFGLVYVEQYHQEERLPGLTEILPTNPDFRLVPKHEEKEYLEIAAKAPVLGKDVPKTLLPKYYHLPPLMAESLNRRNFPTRPCLYIKGLTKEDYGYDQESLIKMKIPYVYEFGQLDSLKYRIADEDNGEFAPVKPKIFVERLKPKQ